MKWKKKGDAQKFGNVVRLSKMKSDRNGQKEKKIQVTSGKERRV